MMISCYLDHGIIIIHSGKHGPGRMMVLILQCNILMYCRHFEMTVTACNINKRILWSNNQISPGQFAIEAFNT
jgi:hypothetical protein